MQANNPAISVVMSVYNSEEYLADAIDSILNQTFTNFEFVILNDGSTDKSLSIIESYMGEDERIVLISRENKGLPSSLNEGISIAKGKYIARMDADDISLPERLQTQFDFMESNPEIGVCGAWAYLFRDKPVRNNIIKHPEDHGSLIIRLLFSVCFVHPTVLIRRSVLDGLNYVYNKNFNNSQDYELWSRLAGITQFYNIQNPLLFYRISQNGITSIVNNDGINKRYPLVSQIQRNQLLKLGIVLGRDESIMHFRLGLNSEMMYLDESAETVYSFFSEIINANYKCHNFDENKLYKFLSKKYFIYLFLSLKRDKAIRNFSVFDMMFFNGALQVLREKLNLIHF